MTVMEKPDDKKKTTEGTITTTPATSATMTAPDAADTGPSPFSLADQLARRQAELERKQALYQEKQQRAIDLYNNGQNPILAYVQSLKPERDLSREKRMRNAAKITAWGDFLSALGTGIVGMATRGYVPRTGSDMPLRMLGKVNEWERLYDQQNRAFQRLQLNALMGQQNARQKAADMDAADAAREYASARQRYDALLGGAMKQEQDAKNRKAALEDKMRLERLRGQNNIRTAQIRAAASYNRGRKEDKPAVSFLDRDDKTVINLNPAQEAYWLQRAVDAGIVPKDGTPLRPATNSLDKPPQYYYAKLNPAQKAMLLRRAYLQLTGEGQSTPQTGTAWYTPVRGYPKRYTDAPYNHETLDLLETPEAEKAREHGYSDQDILNFLLNY